MVCDCRASRWLTKDILLEDDAGNDRCLLCHVYRVAKRTTAVRPLIAVLDIAINRLKSVAVEWDDLTFCFYTFRIVDISKIFFLVNNKSRNRYMETVTETKNTDDKFAAIL